MSWKYELPFLIGQSVNSPIEFSMLFQSVMCAVTSHWCSRKLHDGLTNPDLGSRSRSVTISNEVRQVASPFVPAAVSLSLPLAKMLYFLSALELSPAV